MLLRNWLVQAFPITDWRNAQLTDLIALEGDARTLANPPRAQSRFLGDFVALHPFWRV